MFPRAAYPPGGGSIVVGTTVITSGTNGKVLYDNSGVIDEMAVTGTGNVVLSVSPTLTGTLIAAAANWSDQQIVTSANAAALAVGPNGNTNPVFRVVTNVASAATGLSVTGNAAGSGVMLAVLSSGSNESAVVVPKGTGVLAVQNSDGNAAHQVQVSHNGTSGTVATGTGTLYLPQTVGDAVTGWWTIRKSLNTFVVASNAQFNWCSTNVGDGTPDTGLARNAAKVVSVTDGGSGKGWLQNSAGRSRLTADATNATATMANLSDLSQTLIAGRKYFGQLVVYASNSQTAEGIQIDFGGGSCTATSFVAGIVGVPSGTTIGVGYSTALATALTVTTATTTDVAYVITFEIVVNVGGTLIPRIAEISHTSGTATARLGSYLLTEDSPN